MGRLLTQGCRNTRKLFLVLLCFSLCAGISCSSGQKKTTKKSSSTAKADQTSNRNQINELQVQELDTSTLITIEGVREPDFTVFKLNDPLRVVVDLANTELGTISGPFAVRNGTINEINTTQFDDAASSISRIIIGFDQVVDYEVVPEGTRLKINVQRIGAKPENAQDIVAKGSDTAATSTPLSTSAELSDETVATPDPSLDAALVPTNPATQIIDVKVDPSKNGEVYSVTLIADGKIDQYNAFRLEKPLRLVVDLPGLSSGYAKKKINAPAPLKTIRLGSDKDKLRIVMDARNAKDLPEHTAELEGDRLVLRLGGASAVPPLADAGSMEEKSSSEVDSVPSTPTGPIAKISSLDFKQLPKVSRISISAPDTVSYQSMPFADGKVIVELVGALIPKPLQRSLDTSEFDSAVTLISAYPVKKVDGVVRVEVKMREDVPLTINRENGVINLDFERTKVFVASSAAVPSVKKSTTPEGLAPESVPSPTEPQPATEEAPWAPSMEEESLVGAGKASGKSPASESTLIGKAGFEGAAEGSSDGGQLEDIISAPGGISGAGGQRFTGRRISLDFKDADIKNIFRLIAEVSKLNIVVGDNVSGKITLRLINVPWDQSLAIILQSKKLGIVRYDNILRIAPLTELEQERKEALSAKEAERDLEDLKVLVVPVNYSKADDLKAKIQNLLTKRGRLTVDTRTNTIILEDIQEVLVKARSLVKTLDTQTNQVVIDARVVTASRNWQRALGIQWGGSYQASSATGNPTGLAFPGNIGVGGGSSASGADTVATPRYPGFAAPNYAVNLPASGENGSLGISLGSLTGIGQLDVRLNALENESKARVISSPRVTTLDNISAKINQGTKIPFATVSSAGTQTTFVDATLELTVTPHITNDKSVFMKLSITNNSVGDITAAGPQINIAETNTEMLVKDGDTAVIGGIYVLTDNKTTNGIPWLRSVPVLKVFFSNYARINNRSELLFFITPRIVLATSLTAAN